MSCEYNNYLKKHISSVQKAFYWIKNNIPTLVNDENLEWQICFNHDQSKYQQDEYDAYDNYFYGNKSYSVVQDFKRAWLLHIHRNPHHWQHWILVNDDPDESENLIEMPYNYIIEMVCDWWSFSWAKGELYEISGWYEEHKNYIKLHPKTKSTVEDILNQIKEKLDVDSDELSHHGIKGQKWGVRNGPPYPLKRDDGIEKTLNSDIIKSRPNTVIPDEKFTKYALNFDKAPDKAKAFKDALGYTQSNYKELINNIVDNFDETKLVDKGNNGYGIRYHEILKIKGPNGKIANVMTAWIRKNDSDDLQLTSAYITKKKVE